MQSLFKNKIIILLLCLISLALVLRSDKEQPMPISAQNRNKNVYSGGADRSFINPNPAQYSSLKNPFKIAAFSTALTNKDNNSSIALMGTVAQNNEVMAIIAVHGKSDFYRSNQKVLEYTIQEINSTSVVLYNEHTKQRSILHIKE